MEAGSYCGESFTTVIVFVVRSKRVVSLLLDEGYRFVARYLDPFNENAVNHHRCRCVVSDEIGGQFSLGLVLGGSLEFDNSVADGQRSNPHPAGGWVSVKHLCDFALECLRVDIFSGTRAESSYCSSDFGYIDLSGQFTDEKAGRDAYQGSNGRCKGDAPGVSLAMTNCGQNSSRSNK